MKKLSLWPLLLLLTACTSNNNSTLVFECEQQSQGEACLKLGNAASGTEALERYRKGCTLGSSMSCVAQFEKGSAEDKSAAAKSLQGFCNQGNKVACEKAAALPRD